MRTIFFLLLSLMVLPASPVPADTVEPAGFIQVARGRVQAMDSGGRVRALQEESPVFTGDVIQVRGSALAQIMLGDGMVLVLTDNAVLFVEDFTHSWGSSRKKDFQCRLSLASGLMRIWSGRIITKNRDDGLVVRTPAGSAHVGAKMSAVQVGSDPVLCPAVNGAEIQEALALKQIPVTWIYQTGFSKYPVLLKQDAQDLSITPGEQAEWDTSSGTWKQGKLGLGTRRILKMAEKKDDAPVPTEYARTLGRTMGGGASGSGSGSSGGG